ncbi:MAG: hypothetical protein ACR2O8_17370 [Rhizobiaceae bacterium]
MTKDPQQIYLGEHLDFNSYVFQVIGFDLNDGVGLIDTLTLRYLGQNGGGGKNCRLQLYAEDTDELVYNGTIAPNNNLVLDKMTFQYLTAAVEYENAGTIPLQQTVVLRQGENLNMTGYEFRVGGISLNEENSLIDRLLLEYNSGPGNDQIQVRIWVEDTQTLLYDGIVSPNPSEGDIELRGLDCNYLTMHVNDTDVGTIPLDNNGIVWAQIPNLPSDFEKAVGDPAYEVILRQGYYAAYPVPPEYVVSYPDNDPPYFAFRLPYKNNFNFARTVEVKLWHQKEDLVEEVYPASNSTPYVGS